MTITPDRARKLIHEHDNHRPKALLAAAPDLAQTIAGMTAQWGVRFPDGSEWWPEQDSEATVHAANLDPTAKIVRRLVSAPEVLEGE